MTDGRADPELAELLVCVKCQRGDSRAKDALRPGEHLLENLTAAGPLDGLTIVPVECMANCSNGCTVALRGAGRWTYVFGNLHEEAHVDTIREGAARYRASDDGIVPWRDRPTHFRRNCIARIPPLDVAYG